MRYQADSLLKKKKNNNEQNLSNDCGCGRITTFPSSMQSQINGYPTASVFLQIQSNASNTITHSAYAVTGVTGTIKQIGAIEPTYYNCISTFKMYLSNTYVNPQTGLTVTGLITVYGNVQCAKLVALGAITNNPPPPPE
ncbi:MAG: hypothetical protein ACR2FN_00765 [Chitinophagaceae bacterium]